MRSNREIAEQYFKDHPEKKEEVLRAYYAYGDMWDKKYVNHSFWKDTCTRCGKTRNEIRHGSSYYCKDINIGQVIFEEEMKYQALRKRAKIDIPRMTKNGVDYDFLWDTHGFDRELVDEVLGERCLVRRN